MVKNLSLIKKFIACPFCKSYIKIIDKKLICKKCKKKIGLLHDEIINIKKILNKETVFSERKWDEIYLTDFSLKEAELEYKKNS